MQPSVSSIQTCAPHEVVERLTMQPVLARSRPVCPASSCCAYPCDALEPSPDLRTVRSHVAEFEALSMHVRRKNAFRDDGSTTEWRSAWFKSLTGCGSSGGRVRPFTVRRTAPPCLLAAPSSSVVSSSVWPRLRANEPCRNPSR